MSKPYQIAIIGAGPGGYVAAIRCAQRGASVALIEKDSVGGVCLNRGCIPTKTLIATAKNYQFMRSAHEWGIHAGDVSFDWKSIQERKNRIILQLRRGVEYLLKKNKIALLRGEARIIAPHKIEVIDQDNSSTLKAEKIILATGSKPAEIPLFPIDGVHVINSNTALSLERLPKSLLIIGGGVIGCEFACLFSAFDVKVTLVEALPDILTLSSLDSFIIRHISGMMKRQGILIKTSSQVQEIKLDKSSGMVQTKLRAGETLVSEKVLVSIGRRSNVRGLGLEKINLGLSEKGDVIVDDKMRANVPDVYAIGDVTGQWQLAHVASFQGKIAAEHATGSAILEMNPDVAPSCIFTEPPAACVGLSETEAQKRGVEVVCGEFPYRALGKSYIMDGTEGWVKVVTEKSSGRVLGAHIVGDSAPELIHEFALAIQYGLTAPDMARVIHAHPTYSESIPEACEAIFGMSVHK